MEELKKPEVKMSLGHGKEDVYLRGDQEGHSIAYTKECQRILNITRKLKRNSEVFLDLPCIYILNEVKLKRPTLKMCPFLYQYFKFSNNNFIFLLCFHKIVNTKERKKKKKSQKARYL